MYFLFPNSIAGPDPGFPRKMGANPKFSLEKLKNNWAKGASKLGRGKSARLI